MSPEATTRQLIRGLFRAVALLFLVTTFADMSSPGDCAEELLGLPAALAHSDEGGCAELGGESHDESAPAHSGREDCFCCCAHIITAEHFILPDANLRSDDTASRLHAPRSIPPAQLYRPPLAA